MFKKGDVVVCIDNYDPLSYNRMILGKKYVVQNISDYNTIIFVEGEIGGKSINRFIPLTEYRRLKINKICLKKEIL